MKNLSLYNCILITFFNTCAISFCDAPLSVTSAMFDRFGFQEPASPLMEGLIALHSDIWAIMLFVAGFVLYMMCAILYKFSANNSDISYKVHHHSLIEIIWTTVPALILCVIAIPSFTLLYSLDEVIEPSLTIKAIGRQWYWSYEYGDYEVHDGLVTNGITFDSNVLQDDDLEQGQLRLLDVDNRLVLPVNKHIRLLTSGGDVIHSFAVPSLGVKLDAIPGRLNQTMLFIKRQGVFYGQCSELCGSSHGMMPIALEAVREQDYVDWVNIKLQEM
uniref:Cytochrome c oxidase subunit 2 n=2 Tax=Ulva TaxID=3118 RepID=A0A222AIJ0_ULVPE|nr:cytochrome c oxidase subunit 2 [Ulva pertusa]YP_010021447.1 cytochrome c oxidase subunit 2 [Ulva australis]ASO76190.1 cytochrome c oxidase subunit 2 [Ulva pertusa]ASO76231.1 cytochrome c oxidase subunit 2 [Ulva pertusa]QOL10288.1 cytochrome c oxidase subunit 2 [Ulva australis]